jgi:hypothetical protein
MEKLKLTEGQVSLLRNLASVVATNGEEWYYLPFWFKDLGHNVFEIYRFEKLPPHLIEHIKTLTE